MVKLPHAFKVVVRYLVEVVVAEYLVLAEIPVLESEIDPVFQKEYC